MQKFKLIEKTKKRNPYYINRYDIEYRYLLNEENCNGFKLKLTVLLFKNIEK
jgi:hypothetical protein